MASTLLPLHIAAGAIGLLTGYVALYSAKGAPLHRKSGMLFVAAMLPMSVSGMLIAAIDGVAPMINIPAALITFYTVVTAVTTVRAPAFWSRSFDRVAMLVAFVGGAGCFVFAMITLSRGGRGAGMAYPLFIFGTVALLAGRGDLQMIRAGGVTGSRRLRRHLWRMCFALFVAAGSFFLGQADEIPRALRIVPLLMMPVLAVLATMGWWMWRLRSRKGPAALGNYRRLSTYGQDSRPRTA